MSNYIQIVYVLIFIALIFFLNNSIIQIFKIKNPKTKIYIDFVSLGACLSIFFMLPIKLLEYIIMPKNPESLLMKVKENDIYIEVLRDSVGVGFYYSDFFVFSLILFGLSILFFLTSLFFNKKIVGFLLNSKECEDEKILKIVSKISKDLGMETPKVMIYEGKLNACVYGYPPIVALGKEIFDSLNKDEIEMVLRHELHHIKNRDTILNFFLLSLRILLFYNPIVHLLHARIVRQREYVIDKITARTKREKITLFSAMTKLNKTKTSSFFPTFVTGNFSERFDVLLDSQKIKIVPILISILLTVTLVSSGVEYFGKPTYVLYGEGTKLFIENLDERYPNRNFEITIEEISEQKIIIKLRHHEEKFTNFSFYKDRYQFYLEEDKEFLKIYKKSNSASNKKSQEFFDEEIKILLSKLGKNKVKAVPNGNF